MLCKRRAEQAIGRFSAIKTNQNGGKKLARRALAQQLGRRQPPIRPVRPTRPGPDSSIDPLGWPQEAPARARRSGAPQIISRAHRGDLSTPLFNLIETATSSRVPTANKTAPGQPKANELRCHNSAGRRTPVPKFARTKLLAHPAAAAAPAIWQKFKGFPLAVPIRRAGARGCPPSGRLEPMGADRLARQPASQPAGRSVRCPAGGARN